MAADEGENLFKREKLNAIRKAKETILAIDEVKSVTSFVDAYRAHDPGRKRNIRTVAEKSAARRQILQGNVPDIQWKPARYWPISPAQQARTSLKRLRKEATSDELIRRALISEDGTKHSFLIAIHPDEQLSIPRQKSLWQQVENILKDNSVGENGIFISGLPVTNAAIGQEIENAFVKFLPIGFLAVAIFVFLIYRDWKITALNVLIGVIAVIWSLGMTSFVYGEITILVAATPLVVLSVATTDFLHITTAYQLALQQESDKQKALTKVMLEVGGACVLTSLTTFVGFASLTLTQSVAVQQFGFTAATGVSIALLLMITLLPLVYRKIKPIASPVDTKTYRAVDHLVNFCRLTSQKFPRLIFVFSILICIPGIMLIAKRPIDADLNGRFPKRHPIRIGLEALEQDFYGSNAIELYVRPKEGHDLFDPKFVRGVKSFIDEWSKNSNVLKLISVTDLYAAIDKSISYRTNDHLPPTSIAAKTSIDWIRKVEPEIADTTITKDGSEIRIRAMVRSGGFRETNRFGESLRKSLQESTGTGYQVEMGGSGAIIGGVLENIIFSQVTGFFVCVISLTAIMIWGLGSWRVGILAQIPNLIPVLLMVSLVALCLDRLDSDLLGLPMIALGIAVDDTIHFLHRYRNPDKKENETKIAAVFRTTGRSIVISTLALCVGLFPLAFAQIISLWMIGTFLVVGIFGALIADLFCLPAMIKLGIIRY